MEDRYMYEDMSKILKDRQIGDFKDKKQKSTRSLA